MKLLVISGGRHPYEESTPILDKFLNDAGHQVTVTEHASILADATKWQNLMRWFSILEERMLQGTTI
ncbi:MAG: hypothetical protein CM1200mP15_11080 [Dehalococcoidia bacterium]|nr:MAG: hypothetical protein CM1200mP15_11080 [Dehalococcoidia bacterium]